MLTPLTLYLRELSLRSKSGSFLHLRLVLRKVSFEIGSTLCISKVLAQSEIWESFVIK